ncbi:alcohol oxidase [Aspergillus steynii IBT 23096]|uniref:Alcohol oxidase n=1 Tax=Aspergillus steynii IBT 23096 TaxID=1392250 RepID=A0A2I2G0X1_9EURO|nr:alcohol oxidase [Aspergillus steynii IBT 23096]PLB46518.1 alcohol oxidase [Aspergillus steynii IBT 23096]
MHFRADSLDVTRLAVFVLLILHGNIRTYDYVVVGGGTAGIAVATRLAQMSFTVALVEAGGYYQGISLAPIPSSDLFRVGARPRIRSLIDWGFVAEPQPGANMRYIHYARGRCLGGSSAINFMIYQRPTRDSMAEWAATVNDSSYTWDRVLPYFKRSVHFTPPDFIGRFPNATPSYDPGAYDPKGGPLEVSFANFAMPFSSWMKLGMNAIGIDDIRDFNEGSLLGAQYCTVTVRPPDETRSSSQTAFLGKSKPPTMDIFTYTLAQKILFDSEKRATGVLVTDKSSASFELRAVREVVLSAGALQSPQLLMVSGIGPAPTLQDHGIPVIADLPGVGQNMWDHPFFGPSYRVQVVTFTEYVNDIWFTIWELIKWLSFGRGMGSSTGADFLAWEKIPTDLRMKFSNRTLTDLEQFPPDWPEAEYISGPGYVGAFADPVFEQPKDGYRYASILGVLVAPTSRGNVTIRSANMAHFPVINPNWLDTDTDQEVAIAMFKRIREAASTSVMAPVMIGPEYDPGSHVQTDDDILEYIRNSVMTIWHPACTCKMGRADDTMAVVDSEARVFGVERLRVVDASAFPILPPGHPQSTVYMLAEKISDVMIHGSNRSS